MMQLAQIDHANTGWAGRCGAAGPAADADAGDIASGTGLGSRWSARDAGGVASAAWWGAWRSTREGSVPCADGQMLGDGAGLAALLMSAGRRPGDDADADGMGGR